MKKEGIVLAFGKRWDRRFSEKYEFRDVPKSVKGRSSGVYILYNEKRIVYIGKSVKSLRQRIINHTYDHLKDKWNYFSWFIVRKRYTSETEALIHSIFWKVQDVTLVRTKAQFRVKKLIQEEEIKKHQPK